MTHARMHEIWRHGRRANGFVFETYHSAVKGGRGVAELCSGGPGLPAGARLVRGVVCRGVGAVWPRLVSAGVSLAFAASPPGNAGPFDTLRSAAAGGHAVTVKRNVLRRLYEGVVKLLGKPETPGAFYRGLRLMAIDGFVLDLPDTEQNERTFGRTGSGRAPGAFAQARVLSLCETGSHVLWRSLIKPIRRGEIPMARHLLTFLTANMLLLWDRNFLSYDTVEKVIAQEAHLLARSKKNLVFQPIRRLDDGSYVAKLYRSTKDRRHGTDGILVRVTEYT